MRDIRLKNIAILKNGRIVGEQIGYTDEDVLFELFKNNGLSEKNASLYIKQHLLVHFPL